MALDDNNHFCIYCGAKLIPGQNFCSQCGKKVFQAPSQEVKTTSKYDAQVASIEQEYNLKQSKATQLVEKLFDSNHITYEKFTSAITRSNQLFFNQLQITKKMIELDRDGNELLEKEIEDKIEVLKTFITKIENLTDELIISMSSNKKENEEINNLFSDMDDLIDSVKDY